METGIYVHIPFCRSKCFYCGFYSVASLQLKEAYVAALLHEMEMRREYLPEQKVATLYMGGGTPSFLEVKDLETICCKINSIWDFREGAERSVEINPEDANIEKLSALRSMGFNRLTIGVQSFHDGILKRINRTHTAAQAREAIGNAYRCGFENVGIDLIIGLPGCGTKEVKEDLDIVKSLLLQHISVYILSIDSNSVFQKLSEKGKFAPQDDDRLAEQYLMVCEYLKTIGYEHYEISNFARNFQYSRHNIAYWQQCPYIGLGASAHSYDIASRQWNTAHLKTYIDSLSKNSLSFEKEVLTPEDKYNEYLMTNFRTMWGVDEWKLKEVYAVYWQEGRKKADAFCERGWMSRSGDHICMTEQGWLVSDGILSELFV